MITLIIAIIGAITGVLALILQYIEYRKSKVKLKVNLVDNKSFYSTGNTSGGTNYNCKYFGVISIKIINCSALPITIDEAEIKYKKILRSYFSKEITLYFQYLPIEQKTIFWNIYLYFWAII